MLKIIYQFNQMMRLLSRRSILFRLARTEATTTGTEATLNYQHGHPILTLPLPSRGEPVMFSCKPVTGTVGSLIADIVQTDGGVFRAEICTAVRKQIC